MFTQFAPAHFQPVPGNLVITRCSISSGCDSGPCVVCDHLSVGLTAAMTTGELLSPGLIDHQFNYYYFILW